MRNFWKYLLAGVFGFGLMFVLGLLFFSRGWGAYPHYGMMGPGGMMGGWGTFPFLGGFGILGGLMMLLFMVLPVVLIVLAVAGVFSLLRRPEPAVTPPVPAAPDTARTCPACGKPAQAEWTTCPYCGQKL